MAKLISTRRLTFATMMGTLSLAMQAFVPGIPLGWGGKIELADIPAILGAVFTGPVGGTINGFLYGIISPVYLALVPTSVCSLALLGYLSESLKIRGNAILAIVIARVIFDPILASFLFKWIYYGSTAPLLAIWIISLWYDVPSAIISIPLYIFMEKKVPWIALFIKQ